MMDRQLWQQINDLSAEGLGLRAIAKRLAVHRRTVRRALDAPHPPARPGPTGLPGFPGAGVPPAGGVRASLAPFRTDCAPR